MAQAITFCSEGFDVTAFFDAMDAQRRERELTWSELARTLRCTSHQLSGIKTARYAFGMRLAMKIVGWLDRPAATFVEGARW